MLRCVGKLREKLLTIRVAPDVHRDFKTASELKGASMSALIHMFVVQTIRDNKERYPEAFRKSSDYSRPVVTARIKSPRSKVKTNNKG